VAYPIDVQDMQEKDPIKLDAAASRKSKKPRSSFQQDQWLDINGKKRIFMDIKSGYQWIKKEKSQDMKG
jgi:hypothetical protein